MAVINMGVIVTDIRGKLNGNQFNKTRSGNILQRKCNQRKGGSPIQSERRAVFSSFARFWRSLSDSDRAANNANTSSYPVLDRFGNTKFLSGFQLLLRSNINLATLGNSPINVVPGTPPDGAGVTVTAFNIALEEGIPTNASFTTSDLTGDWMNKTFVLYVSPGVSQGITNYNGRYNFMQTFSPDEAEFSFLNSYLAKLPAPSLNSKVFGILDMVDTATGVVVNSYRFSTIVGLGLSSFNVTLTSGVSRNFFVQFGDGSFLVPVGYQLIRDVNSGVTPVPPDPSILVYTSPFAYTAGSFMNPAVSVTTETTGTANYRYYRMRLQRLSDMAITDTLYAFYTYD